MADKDLMENFKGNRGSSNTSNEIEKMIRDGSKNNGRGSSFAGGKAGKNVTNKGRD